MVDLLLMFVPFSLDPALKRLAHSKATRPKWAFAACCQGHRSSRADVTARPGAPLPAFDLIAGSIVLQTLILIVDKPIGIFAGKNAVGLIDSTRIVFSNIAR